MKHDLRRFIKRYIESLDDDDPDRTDAVMVIREVERAAIDLALPEVAKVCQTVATPLLALSTARVVLCECLAALPVDHTPGGMLSLREAAEYLGYREGGLRKLVARNAIRFFQAKRWGPIKFKREWLDTFVDGHTPQKKPPVSRRPKSKLDWCDLPKPKSGTRPIMPK